MDSIILLEKIKVFYEEKKRMPSVREIKNILLRSTSMRQSQAMVNQLAKEGLLIKDKSGKLIPPHHFTSIRKLGVVEAGFPSPAEEELLDTMTLDEWLIERREATYLLAVKGQSMVNAGIQPGDVALVERGRDPKHGDIVIAEVDGKWTMKYYHKLAGKKVALVPANPKFPTIYPKEELRIEAIVTAIIRKY